MTRKTPISTRYVRIPCAQRSSIEKENLLHGVSSCPLYLRKLLLPHLRLSEKIFVLKYNQRLIQLFEAKHISSNLWLMMDHLSDDSSLRHIPGKTNPAADFLLRASQKLNEAIEQLIRDTVPIKRIEIEFQKFTPRNHRFRAFHQNPRTAKRSKQGKLIECSPSRSKK